MTNQKTQHQNRKQNAKLLNTTKQKTQEIIKHNNKTENTTNHETQQQNRKRKKLLNTKTKQKTKRQITKHNNKTENTTTNY